jgi:hypothetical protein
MAQHMNLQVHAKKKETIHATKYFSVTYDEVTTMDNSTWISIHCYVVIGFDRFHMLAVLEHVEEGATLNNLTKVIMANIEAVSGFDRDDIVQRMVCFVTSN